MSTSSHIDWWAPDTPSEPSLSSNSNTSSEEENIDDESSIFSEENNISDDEQDEMDADQPTEEEALAEAVARNRNQVLEGADTNDKYKSEWKRCTENE